MELVKHETCQEYFRRRLSEGWKCISLEGYNAVLLSPWGFRRELDLRNDVETLRPNAAGDETNLGIAGDTPAATNWESVAEVIADDNATFVRCEVSETWQRDFYNLQDHIGSGTINKITVYARCKQDESVGGAYDGAKIAIKSGTGTGAPDTPDEAPAFTPATSWGNHYHEWATNPATGNPWTWDEIDKLQAGISLHNRYIGEPLWETTFNNCTQLYVVVDYTPVVGLENKSANMGAKMVAAGLI